MTVVPDPAADIGIPIADRTIAAGEAEFPGTSMSTSTDILQVMQSSDSIANRPITTPGAMIAAEAHPTNLAARNTSTRHLIRVDVDDFIHTVHSMRDPDLFLEPIDRCGGSDEDEDEDNSSEDWRLKGGPDDHSKGKQKPTLPKIPSDQNQPKQPHRGGATGTLSQSSKLGTSQNSHGKSSTKAECFPTSGGLLAVHGRPMWTVTYITDDQYGFTSDVQYPYPVYLKDRGEHADTACAHLACVYRSHMLLRLWSSQRRMMTTSHRIVLPLRVAPSHDVVETSIFSINLPTGSLPVPLRVTDLLVPAGLSPPKATAGPTCLDRCTKLAALSTVGFCTGAQAHGRSSANLASVARAGQRGTTCYPPRLAIDEGRVVAHGRSPPVESERDCRLLIPRYAVERFL
ncbi:hypothetical protein NUW54_g13550 [Trametes sanguinea]|uniref:Uncharacterized protein n=1 Tax=Trametes sanguinea TaxID=158606 RepID=A0ACC1MKB0_9APHY|nr:hypothetical protein NUW54_g13550 [Trametes sanguinea]